MSINLYFIRPHQNTPLFSLKQLVINIQVHDYSWSVIYKKKIWALPEKKLQKFIICTNFVPIIITSDPANLFQISILMMGYDFDCNGQLKSYCGGNKTEKK